MTLHEIKQINIREYLNYMGIHPANNLNYYGMYYCPFRSDRNASFKVDYRKNVWHDFGTNEGGTIIDLAMKIENCSLQKAIAKLEKDYAFSFHRNTIYKKIEHKLPTTSIQKILSITHPKLIAYVQERKIDLDLANHYCRELHYQNQDKAYFSVGFMNDKGGYELSSPPAFKGCIPPKDITTIRSNSLTCLVFEGFWDYLSYLTIQKTDKTKHSAVVLNSVSNAPKAMDFLKSHKEIYTYLDNDATGQRTTEQIKSACVSVINHSERFAGFKDLNDFLCQKPIVRQDVKK